jgi:hypothetical protein
MFTVSASNVLLKMKEMIPSAATDARRHDHVGDSRGHAARNVSKPLHYVYQSYVEDAHKGAQIVWARSHDSGPLRLNTTAAGRTAEMSVEDGCGRPK